MPKLTTEAGSPLPREPYTQSSALWTEEKLAHFAHGTIPPRPVFASGKGALGKLVSNGALSGHTDAALFADGAETPVFMRFSRLYEESVLPFGAGLRFYTTEGNFDLLSLDIPVFPVFDAALVPDYMRAAKAGGQRLCDFLSRTPQCLPSLLYALARPHGREVSPLWYAPYTHVLLSGANSSYVRFYLRTTQCAGESIEQAVERTLCYEMVAQVLNADTAQWDVANPTLPFPNEAKSLCVGTIRLDRLPGDNFADVEQAAFAPGHTVPGIGLYEDAFSAWMHMCMCASARHRLGINLDQIPVNMPHSEERSYHRDGAMCVDGNYAAERDSWLLERAAFSGAAQRGAPVSLTPPARTEAPSLSAAAKLYTSLCAEARREICESLAHLFTGADSALRERFVSLCIRADAQLGRDAIAALGVDPCKIHK